MFFRRNEPQGPSAMTVLVVGTLAAIGVFAIATRGRELLDCATGKMKTLMAQKCDCESDCDSDCEE